ncbi:MAG TPA: hypothetical protein VGJ55_02380 [Pyrinomonadaceae bacterium]|jgi:sugar lactone lactonase YvrE
MNRAMNSTKRAIFCATLMIIGLCALPADKAAAHPATGIVVDRKGQVYFSDLETVWKLSTDGKLSVFRSGVNGRHVHELAIDSEDNIYGADISYVSQKWISDVWKMTPEGKSTYLLEPTDNPPRGMSLWRDHDGNMYIVDQNNHTKTQTLLLRRTPDGKVTTFAGSAYGHKDGKGTEARFSSVGGIAFGPDQNLYLTDGTSVRKVTMDGTVTTVAKDLDVRTSDDKPSLFGGSYGSLSGLSIDSSGNVYVADPGNRRLLKINNGGKVEVVLRSDPPYFPNGVVTTSAGDIYVMEVGFTLPSKWSGPRIRRITADGKNILVGQVRAEGGSAELKAEAAQVAGRSAEATIGFFYTNAWAKYAAGLLLLSLVPLSIFAWKRRQRKRHA